MKAKIAKGVAFEIDPNKSYIICFDRSSGLTLEDLSHLRDNLPFPNSIIAIMVKGDPNQLVKVIEAPKA